MKLDMRNISVENVPKVRSLRALVPEGNLHAIGNVDLVNHPAIGICGSRDASEEALTWAHKFGQEAVKHGLLVVSGYARGVDRQAHKGALEAGGNTIAVLPEGIEYFRLLSEIVPMVNTSNFLAVSMFEPQAKWMAWRAMQRNKLIVALSLGMFVVEARESGGTIEAAKECVRQGKPLWAISYSHQTAERQGNVKLLQEAAIPLTRLKDVRKALEDAKTMEEKGVQQLSLALNS